MRLIGDIGGTNARFALADRKGTISEVKNFLKQDYKNVTEAILDYRKSVGAHITEMALAVNAPVVDGWPHINMNNWGYENKNIAADVGIEKVIYFNDLQAHAMSLPFLKEEDKVKIFGGEEKKDQTIAVIGPGTGLGLAYGVYDKDTQKHIFYPSEGGNQVASPADEEQIEIIQKVLKTMSFVRWEDLSSGRGIASIYGALFTEDKTTDQIMKEFSEGSEKSRTTFKYFCEFLGTFTHNVATVFLPEGGIYIIGGILTRKENIEFLINYTKFLYYYNSRDVYKHLSTYLSNYPIYLITHFNPALLGLANYKFS